MKKFSIIVPVYYNELNLPDTIPQLLGLKDKLQGYFLELIFVDDGSGDQSLDILLYYQAKYPEIIKVVKLTRNFGSMNAVHAGFTVASGDCVGVVSADLQDPPELFLDMISYWEKGTKVVLAVRQDREESFWQKLFSNTYYFLIRKFAITDYPKGGFDLIIVDRQVVVEVIRTQEKNANIMTIIFWLGFKPVMIPYIRRRRKKGKSRWSLSKKFKLFVDTLVSFSFFPIRLLSTVGFFVAIGSFIYGLFLLFYRIFFGTDVEGYVSIMLSITFLSGIQMAMLGVLGEYIWRTMDEVRHRPSFVIDMIYEATKSHVSDINQMQGQE